MTISYRDRQGNLQVGQLVGYDPPTANRPARCKVIGADRKTIRYIPATWVAAATDPLDPAPFLAVQFWTTVHHLQLKEIQRVLSKTCSPRVSNPDDPPHDGRAL
jgi:hypothetical protein